MGYNEIHCWQKKNYVFNSYLYGMCFRCIFRELEANLERSGVPVSIFLVHSSFHPCDASCAKDFARSYQCKHGMSFCKDCKELYGVDQKGNCPWHAYLSLSQVDGGACAPPDSTAANLSSAQFNHFDTKCDEECEYFFKKKFVDMCRHNMTRCYSCWNCWDGFAQCSCYKDPPRVDSDEYESSGKDVFSQNPRSGSLGLVSIRDLNTI